MSFTPAKINRFTFWKLPSAWWCGVRVRTLNKTSCTVSVQLNAINKNPFRSIFWAVQGMAAELATGVLLMREIEAAQKNVSMLVLQNKAQFTKKAKGKITFVCEEGLLVKERINILLQSKKPQTIWLKASGVDANGDRVAHFDFEWTLKEKSND